MHYRRLGTSELEVSEIALGSWLTYGTGVGREAARDCLSAAFDVGINFFDTANVSGRGAAERLLGELLRESGRSRDSYLLATKLYFPMGPSDRGLSAAQVARQLDASLERLGTDYVDLYQCHRYDEETPLEETMRALMRAVESGKVRYVGFSEWGPQQIRAAAEMDGVTRFVSSQPQYSLLWRRIEAEIMPLCNRLGISQIVWSPLAQGVLTGKYRPGDQAPRDSRAASSEMGGFMDEFLRRGVLEAVQRLAAVARDQDVSLTRLALAWVLRRREVAAANIGASRPSQVIDNAHASGIALSERTLQAIESALAGYDPDY
jgi:aryl-alcohol dehydrogenase-like predicted oxidoreductase